VPPTPNAISAAKIATSTAMIAAVSQGKEGGASATGSAATTASRGAPSRPSMKRLVPRER
jgi:hypothetical protein